MPLPDRWDKYQPLGCVIPGTRFIAFKVPLKEALCKNLKEEESFTPEQLIQSVKESGHRLGLIVDLTFTRKYYNPESFEKHDIQYEKIFTKGHEVPDDDVVQRFTKVVDDFSTKHQEEGALIGVHCTHGVNRTGYLVCRYMIEHLNMAPESAISLFGQSRGHPIERGNYTSDLRKRPLDPEAAAQQRHHNRKQCHSARDSHERMSMQHPHPQHLSWHAWGDSGQHQGFHSTRNSPRQFSRWDQPRNNGPQMVQKHGTGRGHSFRGHSSPLDQHTTPFDHFNQGHGRYHSASGHCSPLDRVEQSDQLGWGNAARSGWGSSMSGFTGNQNTEPQRNWDKTRHMGYTNQHQNYSWQRPGSLPRGTCHSNWPSNRNRFPFEQDRYRWSHRACRDGTGADRDERNASNRDSDWDSGSDHRINGQERESGQQVQGLSHGRGQGYRREHGNYS